MQTSKVPKMVMLQSVERFLETIDQTQTEFSCYPSYSEIELFETIQYFNELKELLIEDYKQNNNYLKMVKEHPNHKIVDENYCLLTLHFLLRQKENILTQLAQTERALQVCLKQVQFFLSSSQSEATISDKSIDFKIKNWLEWWKKAISTLTEEDWHYLVECKKQCMTPIHLETGERKFNLDQTGIEKPAVIQLRKNISESA